MTSATYNLDNQLTNWGGGAPSYNLNGNLVTYSGSTYGWDVRDRLTSVGSVSFAYDAFNRRKSVTSGGTTTSYLYDRVNPVQEIVSASPTANLLTGLGIDQIFTRTTSAGTFDFLGDALGSTVALTSSSQRSQRQHTRLQRRRPGLPGWRGKNHRHYNECKEHLPPGAEIPDLNIQSCGLSLSRLLISAAEA